MKQHWFHILLALAEQDRHGAGIVRDVLALTGGALRLWPATLYGSLDELHERGWIEELADPEVRPEGESAKRRIYRISEAGRRALLAELDRVEMPSARSCGASSISTSAASSTSFAPWRISQWQPRASGL
jgi:DNA-binding PadR family transcriptional regulator